MTQMDLDGTSFRESFSAREAPSARTAQYFEMVGSRAMYCDGWKVTTNHVGPTPPLENQLIPGSPSYDTDHWALFDLNSDFAENNDLSAQHPEIVTRLVNMWWTEAAATTSSRWTTGGSSGATAGRPHNSRRDDGCSGREAPRCRSSSYRR